MMQWVRMPQTHQRAQGGRQQQANEKFQIVVNSQGRFGHILRQSGKHNSLLSAAQAAGMVQQV